MKYAIGLAVVILVGIIAWRLGGTMNSNALSMAVGVLFGMLAGIPTALLVATTSRQPQQVQHHHEHDVTVRVIPPRVRSDGRSWG